MADINNPLIEALRPLTSRVRTNVTAMKLPTGGSVWTKEPLSDVLMAKHLNGGPARGCGFIQPGESVTKVATLDLDSHKGEVPWDDMVAAAEKVIAVLEANGVAPNAFASSGGSGVHIISVWDEPQDAYSVRQFMRAVLVEAGFKDGTKGVAHGEIEVFPKQDQVEMGGHGNQCILPLAGKSVPLEPLLGYQRMTKEHALTLDWPGAKPVPVLQRPERVLGGSAVTLDELKVALKAIPNTGGQELDYEKWRDVVFGIHAVTGGSEEGLAMAHEFSARSRKYDKAFLNERTWPYIKSKDGGITGRTVLALARECGWEGQPEVFDAVMYDTPTGQVPLAAPKFKRDKNGAIEATVVNCLEAMRSQHYSGMVIRRDTFIDEIVYAKVGCDQWMKFGDDDYVGLREVLERRGFKPITRELIRDVVGKVAREHEFDSAIAWLRQQHWDGKVRIESFLTEYMGVPDSPYARAVSRYIWTALAGRVLHPGVKADMVPIFVGEQGVRKSSAVAAMSPAVEFFAEFNLGDRDADMSRKMRGRLVGEIGELRGLHTKDLESVKSFLTQTHEKWTPKFKEFETTFPRRLVFFGTTNQDEFLADPTGNRRFLPIRIGTIDVDKIAADRNLLWAEGAVLFAANGVDFAEAEKLANSIHAEHTISDPWAEIVETWLFAVDPISGEIPAKAPFITSIDVLMDCLGMDAKAISKAHEMRIAAVLKQIGYFRKKLRFGREVKWAFVPS